MDKIADRILKILAKTSNPNEHEAEVAMTMAQELLLKHNLAIEDLHEESEDYIEEIVVDTVSRGSTWQRILLQSIAKSNSCTSIMIKSGKTKKYVVIGSETNAEACKTLYFYFFNVVTRLTHNHHEYNKIMEFSRGSSYYNSYRIGMSSRIGQRLNEAKLKAEAEGSEEYPALVVRSYYEKQDMLVNDYMEEFGKDYKIKLNTGTNRDMSGYEQGYEDGGKVSLSQRDTSNDQQGQIGGM